MTTKIIGQCTGKNVEGDKIRIRFNFTQAHIGDFLLPLGHPFADDLNPGRTYEMSLSEVEKETGD